MSFSKDNGITLTELLVASALIGIVMIGVASFSVAIKQLQSSTSKANVLQMRTMSAMAQISDDAYNAVGDFFNEGIRTSFNGGNFESICFRRDFDLDPSTYTGDKWHCYLQSSAGQTIKLFKCVPFIALNPNNMNVRCGANNRNFLVDLDPADIATNLAIIDRAAGRILDVHIILNTIYNSDTQPPPTGAGTAHPISNPDYFLESFVSPIAHSR